MTTTEQVTETGTVLRATLAAHPSLYLATTGDSGPWVNGVYFAESESDPFTVSLVLEQRGRTIAAIRRDPRVAMVVATGSPLDAFLQGRALAEEVDGADRDEVCRVLLEKVPAAEPFLAAPVAAIRLDVTSWRVTDIPNGWLPGRELTR